jgi:hypothetical protein
MQWRQLSDLKSSSDFFSFLSLFLITSIVVFVGVIGCILAGCSVFCFFCFLWDNPGLFFYNQNKQGKAECLISIQNVAKNL